MLADPRVARALSANFGAQWLHLRNLSASQPDVVLFPEFDENLREAMRQETEFFLESMGARGSKHPEIARRELYVPE